MRVVHEARFAAEGARHLRGVPYVSQRTPDGAPPGYDGEANCGPSSMTMIANHLGLRTGRDAATVLDLARVGGTTSKHGTSLAGMKKIAKHLGLSCEVTPGADLQRVRRTLAEGGYVIANGDYYAMPPHEDPSQYEGHYVLVHGVDARGRFLVHDPYDPAVETVTAPQLGRFLAAHDEGGYVLALGVAERASERDLFVRHAVPSLVERPGRPVALPTLGRGYR